MVACRWVVPALRRSLLLLAATGSLGACSSAPVDSPAGDSRASGSRASDRLGEQQSALTNASVDTEHQAVVATGCSATILHVDGADGYALTAGHCYGGDTIRQGDDKNAPDHTYDVLARARHPKWDESPLYDYAMLHFTGADVDTPFIPPLPPAMDSLGAGSAVVLVGYGDTQGADNNLRHSVNKSLKNAFALTLTVDQANGGLCGGDSGGGMLTDVAGDEYVAGVHAFISDGCTQGTGTSLRVAPAYDTFIMPFITGADPTLHTCGECTAAVLAYNPDKSNPCADEIAACINLPDCITYDQCQGSCSTKSCVLQCAVDHPSGKLAFDAIFECRCDTACIDECVGDDACAPDPVCGVSDDDASCQSCIESNCCDAMAACAIDPSCYACYFEQTLPAVSCWDNAIFTELQSCMVDACDGDCDVPQEPATGEGGSDPTTAGVGGSTASGSGSGAASTSDDDDSTEESSSCTVTTAPSSTAPPAWLMAALLLVGTRRRRKCAG